MAKFTLNERYDDIDEIYSYTDTDDDRLQLLFDNHIAHYRTKTIKAGNVLECEIYPIWNTAKSTRRARKFRESKTAQKNLNAKNAQKNLTQK